MIKKVIYPGSFDPITFGHIDIIKRSSDVFDEVIIAVSENSNNKRLLFSAQDRLEFIEDALVTLGSPKNIRLEKFDSLLVDYVKSQNTNLVIRGIRSIVDFSYESEMNFFNSKFFPELEVLFFLSSADLASISSSLVKEAASLGADISHFTPKVIADKIKRKLKSR